MNLRSDPAPPWVSRATWTLAAALLLGLSILSVTSAIGRPLGPSWTTVVAPQTFEEIFVETMAEHGYAASFDDDGFGLEIRDDEGRLTMAATESVPVDWPDWLAPPADAEDVLSVRNLLLQGIKFRSPSQTLDELLADYADRAEARGWELTASATRSEPFDGHVALAYAQPDQRDIPVVFGFELDGDGSFSIVRSESPVSGNQAFEGLFSSAPPSP